MSEVKNYLKPAVRDRLTQLIADHDVRSVIEVGSFVGGSAVWFAERVETVVCIDPFDLEKGAKATMGDKRYVYAEAGWATQYETFLANTLAYPNIRSLKMLSLEAARLPLEADLVFIDGSHTYEDVVADIEAWRPKARKVLCGDDNTVPHFDVTAAAKDCGVTNLNELIWWEVR